MGSSKFEGYIYIITNCNCIHGRSKTAGGYIWRHKEGGVV